MAAYSDFYKILLCLLIILPSIGFSQSSPADIPSIIVVQENTDIEQAETNTSLELLYSDKYHNLSEVYKELEHFNNSAPNLIDYSDIGRSYLNNTIPLVTITNEKRPDFLKGKTYIVAHHHAREMCTIENSLRLIRDLINGYSLHGTYSTVKLLDNFIIYIIVTLNPDSLDYTLYTNPHFRKTLKPYDDDNDGLFDEDGPEDLNGDGHISSYAIFNNDASIGIRWWEGTDKDNDGKIGEDPPGGVDINRNYPFHWNDSRSESGSTSDKSAFDYPGLAPFSENETRAIDDFVKQHHFTHALSLHSGIESIELGWSWTDQIQQPEAPIYRELGQYIAENGIIPKRYLPLNKVWYNTAGEWGDYMYTEYNIIPLTFEIYAKEYSEKMYLIEQNETHRKYETKLEDFRMFNPPTTELEGLHASIRPFELFWLNLTPSIELDLVKYQINSNNEYEVVLYLKSGSLFWNTTDSPKITIDSFPKDIVEDFPDSINTLLPSESTKVTLTLNSDLLSNSTLDINISSEWAADLYLTLTLTPQEFKRVAGFDGSIFGFLAVITLIVIRKKNKK